eukprot:scaffold1954_cov268-Pinguiococcus_pyrenoidosus.AAC.91
MLERLSFTRCPRSLVRAVCVDAGIVIHRHVATISPIRGDLSLAVAPRCTKLHGRKIRRAPIGRQRALERRFERERLGRPPSAWSTLKRGRVCENSLGSCEPAAKLVMLRSPSVTLRGLTLPSEASCRCASKSMDFPDKVAGDLCVDASGL